MPYGRASRQGRCPVRGAAIPRESPADRGRSAGPVPRSRRPISARRNTLVRAADLLDFGLPFALVTRSRTASARTSRFGRFRVSISPGHDGYGSYLHDRIDYGWQAATEGRDLSLNDKVELLLTSAQAIQGSVGAINAAFASPAPPQSTEATCSSSTSATSQCSSSEGPFSAKASRPSPRSSSACRPTSFRGPVGRRLLSPPAGRT